MEEKYLHYLWKYKLIPFHQLKLQDGSECKILYQGEHNTYESGPDFLNAKIEINSIVWVGNVEIHVKSSDWYAHTHHTDRAYDNVILHVVYEDNGEVYQNTIKLPTLELKKSVQLEHYKKFKKISKNKQTILCGSLLENIPDIHLTLLKENGLFSRLFRKTQELEKVAGTSHPKQVLYFLMARAMGAKVNQYPFEELAQRLPIQKLKKLSYNELADVVYLTSGMSQQASFPELLNFHRTIRVQAQLANGTMNRESWKRGGIRPMNAPDLRLKQFIKLIEVFDFETEFINLTEVELLSYFDNLFSLVESKNESIKPFSASFKNLLIINCFVPFIFWFGQQHEDDRICEKAIELLRKIPPEQNAVLTKWKGFGCVPKNAADSQAFLEIFNQFCTQKKCLSCNIGICVLSK